QVRGLMSQAPLFGQPRPEQDIPPRLWDAGTGKLIAVLDRGKTRWGDYTTALAISGDGRQIITASAGPEQTNVELRTFVLWDGQTGKRLGPTQRLGDIRRMFAPQLTGQVRGLQLSADGNRMLIVYAPMQMPLGDPRTGQVVEVVDVHTRR